MSLELSNAFESVKEGVRETAEIAHVKTSEFHNNYISKITPDCGKYGDSAKFVAEMLPGVAEYNAIKDGDWQAFAIAAGIDLTAIAIGAFSAGAGYGVVKGGAAVARTGVKVATKEVAEAATKKVVKEVAEAGTEKVVKEVVERGAKKVVKEVAEVGTEKVVKEVVESGAEKAVKEVAETGAEKVVKEVAETGAEKVVKEVVEAGTEKVAKEVAEAGTEKVAKEVVEAGVEKTTKESVETVTEKLSKDMPINIEEKVSKSEGINTIESQIVKNKYDGIAREEKVLEELVNKYGESNVIREALVRDINGIPIKDMVTGEARRIDFIVKEGDKIIKSIEVTSETASKVLQSAKELRILEQAKEIGGAFIKDPQTNKLIKFTEDIITDIWRLQ